MLYQLLVENLCLLGFALYHFLFLHQLYLDFLYLVRTKLNVVTQDLYLNLLLGKFVAHLLYDQL